MSETPQLPLNIRLDGLTTLSQFVVGRNQPTVTFLQRLAEGYPEPVTFISGGAGTGKSHLLQAACQAAHQNGVRSAYVPLGEAGIEISALLEGLERYGLVCIDDVDRLDVEHEAALFRLVNRLREAGGRLLATAMVPAAELPISLPDLRSRLSWGPSFALQPLDDDGKLLVLQHRAQMLGFELPAETGRYLLRHCLRNLPYQLGLLDRLDRASLAAQRRVTVPFVKQLLARERSAP